MANLNFRSQGAKEAVRVQDFAWRIGSSTQRWMHQDLYTGLDHEWCRHCVDVTSRGREPAYLSVSLRYDVDHEALRRPASFITGGGRRSFGAIQILERR
jgi:hypothetical protein